MQTRNSISASIYSPTVRALATLLFTTACAGSLSLAALLVLSENPTNPLLLARLFTAICLVPATGLALLRLLYRGSISIDATKLTIESRRMGTRQIGFDSLAALTPWRLPLPSTGLSIRTLDSKSDTLSCSTPNPLRLIEMIREHGIPQEEASRIETGALRYACARARAWSAPWWWFLIKFPGFALLPTIPLFRVHQIIAYGSPLGEYYLYGAGPFLAGFAIYFGTLTIYLVLFAATIRAIAEPLAFVVTIAAPPYSQGFRTTAERACAFVYYLGVPSAVLLRFVPW